MASKSIILPTSRNKSKISETVRNFVELNDAILEIAVDLAGSTKNGRRLFAAWVNRQKHPMLRKLDKGVKALSVQRAKENRKRSTKRAKPAMPKETQMTPKKMLKRLREQADFLDRSADFSYTLYDLGPIANDLRVAASLMATLIARTPTVQKRGHLR